MFVFSSWEMFFSLRRYVSPSCWRAALFMSRLCCCTNGAVKLAYNLSLPSHLDGSVSSRQVPLAVMVHGLTSTGNTFNNVRQRVSDATEMAVATPDLRGCGKSPEPQCLMEYNLSANANDLICLIATLQGRSPTTVPEELAPVHFVGHSWGSRVVLQLAREHPRLVASVMVVDIFLSLSKMKGGETSETMLQKALKRSEFARSKYVESMASAEEANTFYKETCPTTPYYDSRVFQDPVTGRYSLRFRPHQAMMFDYFCKMADFTDLWLDCGKFSFPILVVKAGGKLTSISDSVFEKLKREAEMMCKQSGQRKQLRQVALVEGAEHTVHRSHPDHFVELCQRFFSAL